MEKEKVTEKEYLEAKAEMEKALAENKKNASKMTYEESFDAYLKFAKLYNVKRVGDDK